MTLRTRLLAYGAILPMLLLGIGFVVTGWLLRRQMYDATDRALLAQTAVEAVSLFDGADEKPHLHLARSALSPRITEIAASAAVFDANGRMVTSYAVRELAPRSPSTAELSTEPELRTRRVGHHTVREAMTVVEDADGHRFVLWVGATLDREHRVLLDYVRSALLVLVLCSVGFFLLQKSQADRLSARLERLAEHSRRVRAGELGPPDEDDQGDIVSDLRDALARTTERLRASQDAEQRLIADAAHELRTPLTAMRAVIDTTLRRERGVDELRESLVHTREEVDRLAALADELLDLTSLRQVAASREDVDLGAMLGSIVASFDPLAREKDVRLVLSPDARPTVVQAASTHLRRALENLAKNAIQHAPEGSRVDFAWREVDGAVRIDVRDVGEGVRESEREAIFEPFRRGEREGSRGTGLGLAIVRDVARMHGGAAWVEPVAPRGACFVISLPTASEDDA